MWNSGMASSERLTVQAAAKNPAISVIGSSRARNAASRSCVPKPLSVQLVSQIINPSAR
jgi:hypothetical protein